LDVQSSSLPQLHKSPKRSVLCFFFFFLENQKPQQEQEQHDMLIQSKYIIFFTHTHTQEQICIRSMSWVVLEEQEPREEKRREDILSLVAKPNR